MKLIHKVSKAKYTINQTDNNPQNHSTNNGFTVSSSSYCEGKWIEKPNQHGIRA